TSGLAGCDPSHILESNPSGTVLRWAALARVSLRRGFVDRVRPWWLEWHEGEARRVRPGADAEGDTWLLDGSRKSRHSRWRRPLSPLPQRRRSRSGSAPCTI